MTGAAIRVAVFDARGTLVDAACAAAATGFDTMWVNRAGAPRERLIWTRRVLPDLARVPEIARAA